MNIAMDICPRPRQDPSNNYANLAEEAHQPRRAYEQPWINAPPESIVDDAAM
jgi:hypothetical protein